MPRKARRKSRKVLGGTALGAAATAAAATAAALSSPLAAPIAPELNHLGEGLTRKSRALVAESAREMGEVQFPLAGGVVSVSRSLPQRAQPASIPLPTITSKPASGDRPPSLDVSTPAAHHPYSRPLLRKLLVDAAARHHVDPKLVLAVSYWESGWDQSRVSESGAVGLMQVEPQTAAEAGPALLGRSVDVDDPYDNTDVGVAVLREDLDTFTDPAMALAAYYQGPSSLRANGMLPDTRQYVDGILALADRMTP